MKEEIFDLHGTIMMATVEAKHEAEKELIANRAELNLKVVFFMLFIILEE